MTGLPMRSHRGFSLIEMMIALVLGLILILGLVQVFSASRASYALSEGLSRVQENGRFAMDYLQRDLRMAGHFGCANDQFRLQRAGLLRAHTSAVPALDFSRSIQGYEANGTGPTASFNLLSDAQIASPGAWSGSPALPGFITAVGNPQPLPGSDVIVLRYLSGEGVPVTGITSTGVTVDAANWNVLASSGIANPRIFGIADCTYADVFQATAAGAGTVEVSGIDLDTRYTVHPAGQTMLYRAEAVAYYVARGAGGGPALWRVRYLADGTADPEELVEGIESLQLIYGQDPGPVTALTGHIGAQYVANAPELGATETNWRRVGQVRIGLLARSPDRAASAQTEDLGHNLLGTTLRVPGQDGRYRATYESTVALRNRLYGTQ